MSGSHVRVVTLLTAVWLLTACAASAPAGSGAGVVFYSDGSNPAIGEAVLEAAPSGWYRSTADPLMSHAEAVEAAAAYRGGGKADWRLPTISELIEMARSGPAIGGFATAPGAGETDCYWSSTTVKQTQVLAQCFAARNSPATDPAERLRVRPVRVVD